MNENFEDIISSGAVKNDKRIIMLVLDGLGDVNNNGKGTALQIARTPNMDKLAACSALGLALKILLKKP